MASASNTQNLTVSASLLKSRVTRYAVYGVLISILAIVTATLLSAHFLLGEVSLTSIVQVQKENSVLWLLDAMPFGFAVWGQQVGTVMAYEASAMVMDQTQELRAHAAALEIKAIHDANHDALTDLPNRILFRDRVEQAIQSAKRDGRTCAVLLLDLDRFKEINDTIGHTNGDRVIKQVAMRLEAIIRDADTLSRMGGDEFAILLQNISDANDIHLVAEKIHRTLETPFSIEGLLLDVQASIGGVLYPDHGGDVDTLIQRADVAMYVSKQKGYDFIAYSPELDEYSEHRLTLMGELRRSIDSGDLVLWYQPKIDAQSGKVEGVEVLVRWIHHKHGMIFPDEFISLAERTGMIKNLTLWVLEHALRETVSWRQQGLELNVAVNLSTRNLLDPEFPNVVADLLKNYDYPPTSLKLEITETSIMADPEFALQIVQRIADMGVSISIDDFGTGYSSLAYIKRLPVSELKIDKAFVMDMLKDENDAAIVHATIELAHNLGLSVVAEGVEDQATMDNLQQQGCDTLQGYFFSKPLPEGEFREWLAQSQWS
jgi:diguanylate cyclase (GGDEF)-like protein